MTAQPTMPVGMLTFLLTDVEDSTALWEQYPEAMSVALARHDALIDELLARHGGRQIKERGEGDSIFAVFGGAVDAVAAVCAIQEALLAEQWPAQTRLRVRMGLHTGEAEVRGLGYYGTTVNTTARVRGLAHGGQIVLSQATAGAARGALPEGVTLRPLGSHALKGLRQPVEVFQVCAPGLPDDFPPLISPQAPRHNLPETLSSFVGREAEQRAVRALLERARLVTLTGSGGAGKTRLALAVAATLVEGRAGAGEAGPAEEGSAACRYPDGVWLVELTALADPDLVTAAVTRALGLREEPGRPLTATLADYLKARELLLVLDNCEHLVAACASLAASLPRACPRLRILATSREGLDVAGEIIYNVPPLSVPDVNHLPSLEVAPAFEAVRLFVERARARRPEFSLTAANVRAVTQICARLDGIPLAIELAAARVSALRVEGIAARLDDCFRLLTGGPRGALPRQQTLRATLDWSHDLLSAPERAVLRRLAVFAGGCTLAAAEAVCADPSRPNSLSSLPLDEGPEVRDWEVLDLLAALVNKSLLLLEEGDGEGRYRLLETVRQYGRERLAEAGETARVRERHLAWCLDLAEGAEPALVGPEQGAWLARLEAEHANLRAALGWARESGQTERGLRVAGALWRFWYTHGHLGEGRGWLEELLASDPGPSLLPVGEGSGVMARARALRGAGVLAYQQGDFARSAALTGESLTLFRALGDVQGAAGSLNLLGHLAVRQGNQARAIALSEESLTLQREIGDARGIAVALNTLAEVLSRSDQARAAILFEESLALNRELGDTRGISISLTNMAELACTRGEYQRAAALCAESLSLAREIADTWAIAAALSTLGDVARDQGDPARAAALYEECLTLRRDLGDKAGIAALLSRLGEVVRGQGDYARATELYTECLALCRAADDQSGVTRCLEGLAAVAHALGGLERVARLRRAPAPGDSGNAPLPMTGPSASDQVMAAVRTALGESAFAVAWTTGHTTPVETMPTDMTMEIERRGK